MEILSKIFTYVHSNYPEYTLNAYVYSMHKNTNYTFIGKLELNIRA